MGGEPLYLTSPGHAIAQRQRWENLLRREMIALLKEDDALVAAGWLDPRRWSRMARSLTRVPSEMLSRVMALLPVADAAESAEDAVDRVAATLATAAYNQHVLIQLAFHGFTKKRWVTRKDPKVRAKHAEAEGQTVPLGQAFVVGGFPMQYPADSTTAPIELWINDRCVTVGVR